MLSPRSSRVPPFALLLLLAAALSGCRAPETPPPAVPSPTDEPGAVSLALRDLQGRVLDFKALRGKVVVVDVWATWCAPCRRSLPGLAKLSRERPEDIVVVGILSGDDPRNLPRFLQGTPIPYFVGIADSRASSVFPAPALPTIYIVNRKGIIVDKMVGAPAESELQRRAERHL